MLEVLKGAVQARLNIVVSGGTGAGKTTLLNVLSGFISPQRAHRHHRRLGRTAAASRSTWCGWSAGRPTWKARARVRQRELVINALRMRPDRIIVGEVRGEEALDMLQAMNTGHDGSITTVHANTPRDAMARIETMAMMANMNCRRSDPAADRLRHSRSSCRSRA